MRSPCPAMKSSSRLPQLDKAQAQQQRRNAAKKKSCQPRILYLAKLSSKNSGGIKTFPDLKKKKKPSLVDLPYKKY